MPAKTDKSASFTKEDFYVSVDNLVSISVISGLFYLLPAAAFFPDFLPSPTYTLYFGEILHDLSSSYSEALKIVFYCAMLLHLFEAVTAFTLAAYIGLNLRTILKWFVNVFIHGIFALWPLLKQLYEDELARAESNINTRINYDKIK